MPARKCRFSENDYALFYKYILKNTNVLPKVYQENIFMLNIFCENKYCIRLMKFYLGIFIFMLLWIKNLKEKMVILINNQQKKISTSFYKLLAAPYQATMWSEKYFIFNKIVIESFLIYLCHFSIFVYESIKTEIMIGKIPLIEIRSIKF